MSSLRKEAKKRRVAIPHSAAATAVTIKKGATSTPSTSAHAYCSVPGVSADLSAWTATVRDERGGERVVDLFAVQRYRVARVKAELKALNCEGAVLFDPVNIRYATGARNMVRRILNRY